MHLFYSTEQVINALSFVCHAYKKLRMQGCGPNYYSSNIDDAVWGSVLRGTVLQSILKSFS